MVVVKVIVDRFKIFLDIVLVKKIGVFFNREFVIVVVDINGDVVLNNEYVEYFFMKDEYVEY